MYGARVRCYSLTEVRNQEQRKRAIASAALGVAMNGKMAHPHRALMPTTDCSEILSLKPVLESQQDALRRSSITPLLVQQLLCKTARKIVMRVQITRLINTEF